MMVRTAMRLVLGAGLSMGLCLPAHAQQTSAGEAIREAILGNTVRGSMQASGAFEEFYSPDGRIHGADYSGEWSIKGDRMCFAYDGNPPSCWAVRLNDKELVWVGTAGDEGTGTILSGNPNGY